ncbi:MULTISPECIES: alpha/beta hydrolase [unclassified Streptomyces]|uniref:alpha/beta hydrolase n=1 Tax=unclassified Streptomyces TaxID=2593676 RepID=UPI00225103FD|nr:MULTISPECIES: alpha/beta fold hydrolase [unclassified Streptomyces]MCX4525179.1 alpha/beta fold hydrolase [Streptomyces sp. NBC_01551]MCX4544309.1 alpha/beta fold hydrolase [Streptomyces sp. NBC_01565]
MRTATVTAAAVTTTLLGAGAAAIAAGRYAADAALRPEPGRPLPGGPRLSVHGAAAGRVALTRSLASLLPGTYGLAAPGVHAVVGPVLTDVPHGPDTVVRRLLAVTHGSLEPGTRVTLTPQVHLGNPRTALGLDHADVDVPGELGPLPAWFVPAARDTWVITVHGLGAGREHPMVVMPFLHRQRLPVLDLAYRGDLGAPASPDGLGHLGESEWRDLDAAIRYALRYGARRVVLHGWSTGAAMALHAAERSALAGRIAGLVLDSPVLDWHATLRALVAARRTPAPLLPLAIRAAEGRAGLRTADRRAPGADAAALKVPVLIFHGPDDTLAPWEPSRRLADARPDLVTLQTVRDAPHGAMWNADPARYEEALRRFLTPLM